MFFIFTLLLVTNACEPTNTAKSNGSDTLQLNNGQKWKVNEEMMPYIKGMQDALSRYDVTEGDYTMLAETLLPGDHIHIAPMVKHWVKGTEDSQLILIK
jgi:hypothetical protein